MTVSPAETEPGPINREQLEEFANLNPEQKAAGLLTMTRAILATEGPDLDALIDPEAAEALARDVETAFAQTVDTPFLVENSPVLAWEGSGSAAVMTEHFQLAGMRGGIAPGFEDYGDLRRFGLSKTLQAQVLTELDMPGGLLVAKNFRYLKNLGLVPDVELYAGVTTGPAIINGQKFWVGTSGCVVRDDYSKDVLSFMAAQDSEAKLPADIQSGRFDTAFAIGLGRRLEDPDATIEPVEEPECLFDLRMGR